MSLQMLDHEEMALRDMKGGKAASLERALLVLSGLTTEEEIQYYQLKINDIFGRFLKKCDQKGLSPKSRQPLYLHRSIAHCLFEYLWTSKPKRFGESFLLTDVVEAQLNPDVNRTVGTCVGLTSLFSVLGLRAGLNLSLLVALDHVLSRLRVGEQIIDIDHTDPQGFDCGNGERFREFSLLTLPANVLNSRGLRNERNRDLLAAKADYEKAAWVNPEYANACNNRGNMRFREGDIEGALADYTEAIGLDPSFCEAYCNRGMANQRLGRYPEARRDYGLALGSNSEYTDARACLRSLDDLEQNHSLAGNGSEHVGLWQGHCSAD